MKKNIFITITCTMVFALILGNCEQSDDQPVEEGELTVVVGIQSENVGGVANLGGEANGEEPSLEPDQIKIRIEGTSGGEFLNDFLPIFKFGSGYQTDPIKLPASVEGTAYRITEVLALADNQVLWAMPVEGSEMAQFVADPLPLEFSIRATESKTTELDLLPLNSADSPNMFGYNLLEIFITQLHYWSMITFEIDEVTGDLRTIPAHVAVTTANGAQFEFGLDSGMQRKPMIPSPEYELVYSAEGHIPISVGLTEAQLIAYENDPLVITFRPDDDNAEPRNQRTYSEPGVYDFDVPNNVLATKLTFELFGAAGAGSISGRKGGNGGYRKVQIPVTPGESFRLVIGEGGQLTNCNGTNGGGGGGLTGIFSYSSSSDIYQPCVIAAGGGGGSDSGNGCHADNPCNTPTPPGSSYQYGGFGYGGGGAPSNSQDSRGKGAPTFLGGVITSIEGCPDTQSGGFGGGGAGSPWNASHNNTQAGGGGGGSGWPGGQGGTSRHPGQGGKSFVGEGIIIFQTSGQKAIKGTSITGEDGKIIISW